MAMAMISGPAKWDRSRMGVDEGKLKSEVIFRDDRRYYLDLKENHRGRFLKVCLLFVNFILWRSQFCGLPKNNQIMRMMLRLDCKVLDQLYCLFHSFTSTENSFSNIVIQLCYLDLGEAMPFSIHRGGLCM
jgi:PurA ssDNA and RNA-binding protein